MEIEELNQLIATVSAQLNTEGDILGGLYGQVADQKITVDALTEKLNRLLSAHAVLRGIVEIA